MANIKTISIRNVNAKQVAMCTDWQKNVLIDWNSDSIVAEFATFRFHCFLCSLINVYVCHLCGAVHCTSLHVYRLHVFCKVSNNWNGQFLRRKTNNRVFMIFRLKINTAVPTGRIVSRSLTGNDSLRDLRTTVCEWVTFFLYQIHFFVYISVDSGMPLANISKCAHLMYS